MVAIDSQQAPVRASSAHAVENDSAQLRTSAQRLADQAVRLYRWRSGLWWLAAGLLATLGLVVSDYWLHVEEVGLRWLLSLTWLTALVVAAGRLFPPAWRFSLGPVRVAQWIERSRPDLRGELSNLLAIAELPESDLQFGSASFRTAALREAGRRPLAIDWSSYLDWKPTLLAAVAVLSLGLVAVGLTARFPRVAGHGIARLLSPWQSLPWPHADQLQFVNLPAMIASGSELPIEVIDNRPPLPSALELQLLTSNPAEADSAKRLVRLPMRVLDKVAFATVTDMRSDFSVRVVGGDDQETVWQDIHVVEVPELLEQQFHVSPPAYSRQPLTELVGERIEVLAGSKVAFHGRYSSRMRNIVAEAVSAAATSQDSSSSASTPDKTSSSETRQDNNSPTTWPATLSADRQSFDVFLSADGGLVVDSDRRWRLRLETEDGLEVAEPKTWSIHVVADRPPTVNLIPIEPPLVTRDSVVDIVGQATDDLELVEVRLVWQVGEGAEPRKQTLWHPPEDRSAPEKQPGGETASTTAAAPGTPSRQANLNYSWRPGEEQMPLGQPVTVYLEARDSLGQITRSVSQTLQMQDPQTVLAHLQAEEAKTFEPLRQLLNAQKRNEQAVKRTRDIVRETETVTPEQLDALSSARQLEQSVAQQLAHSPTSILGKLQELGGQLQRSALDATELARQVEHLSESIKRLDTAAIQPAVQALERAQQSMRTALEESASEVEQKKALAELEKTAASQEQATDHLSRLVDSIAAAETMASLQKKFSDLERRQHELRAETERFQVERVAHPDARTADATRIGLRSDQLSLARDIEGLITSIGEQLQQQPEAADQSHGALAKARQALVDQQVGQTMRDAADKLDAEQLAEANKAQRAAASAIARAATRFGGSSGATLESSTANLQAVAAQLGGLADQQSTLAEAMREPSAAQAAQELAEQQANLADTAAEVSQELEQQSNHSLSEAVGDAQQRAAQAARQAGQAELAQAAASAQQAAEQFRRAEKMAEQRVVELEKQLASQQLLDLGSAVSELLRRQTPIVDKLTQLRATGPESTDRPADWENQLRDAAAAQEVVRQQLLETSSRMQELATFAWLLDQCEIDMARAVAALERLQLEPGGLTSASSALRKLNAAAQALASSEAGSSGEVTEPTEAASNEKTAEASDPAREQRRPSLASLRLLRALQEAINQETKALQAKGEDQQGLEMLRLADEQQALAEQAQKLMQDIMNQDAQPEF